MAFPTIHLRVSPKPMGHTPGHSSRAIKWLANKALMLSHGMIKLHNSLQNPAIVSCKYQLTDPKQSKTSFQCLELQPPGPAPPSKWQVTV